jgi:hypothetical protein
MEALYRPVTNAFRYNAREIPSVINGPFAKLAQR